ncbi:MAG TPA: hypothetical protein VKV05_03125 [Terriglobales bacterium]|nr:hypothetical protein [Terriglobales bacterium]
MAADKNQFTFLYPQLQEIDPKKWVSRWAAHYDGYDDDDYWRLIHKQGPLSYEDFELMGRWKDNAPKGSDKWKPNVAMVAYDVWMEAADKLRVCPERNDVASFLSKWSEKKFRAGKGGPKSFGLARATTLLHFLSAGQYPIFDSRVIEAIGWLRGTETTNTVEAYLSCCPLLENIAEACGVSDAEGRRKLDKAMFAFGKWISNNKEVVLTEEAELRRGSREWPPTESQSILK